MYNYVLLKMSTWYSKHVEESNNIWRINNIQCITLVVLYCLITRIKEEKSWSSMSGSFSPVPYSCFPTETDRRVCFPDCTSYLATTFCSAIDYYQNLGETYCLYRRVMCFGLTYCLLRQSRISTLKATRIMFQWPSSIQIYHVHNSKVPLIIAVSSGVSYSCHTNSLLFLYTHYLS